MRNGILKEEPVRGWRLLLGRFPWVARRPPGRVVEARVLRLDVDEGDVRRAHAGARRLRAGLPEADRAVELPAPVVPNRHAGPARGQGAALDVHGLVQAGVGSHAYARAAGGVTLLLDLG